MKDEQTERKQKNYKDRRSINKSQENQTQTDVT